MDERRSLEQRPQNVASAPGCARVRAPGDDVRKGATSRTAYSGKGARRVDIVVAIRIAKLWLLEREIIAVEAKLEAIALFQHPPLRNGKLRPGQTGTFQGISSQSSSREGGRATRTREGCAFSRMR